MIFEYLVVFGILYLLAIYFSWRSGFRSGVIDGAEQCLEIMVEERLLDKVISSNGDVEVVGTMDACPKCSTEFEDEHEEVGGENR